MSRWLLTIPLLLAGCSGVADPEPGSEATFTTRPRSTAGGDATKQTLANYQHALSRVAKVTRETSGGLNRISFAPVTDKGVQPRIAELFRWHYDQSAPAASELPCIANYGGNCSCQ
jgi:hypothetical protein